MKRRTMWITSMSLFGYILLMPLFYGSGAGAAAGELERLASALSVEVLVDPVPAADFVVHDVINSGQKKLSDFRGNVIFLNFWATWCPPCRKEMPTMQAIYSTLKDSGFVIVAVSVDRGNEQGIVDFAREFELTFPILHDKKQKVTRAYRIRAIPTTLILNRAGEVVGRAIGARNWNSPEAQQLFRLLLAEEAVES